LAALSSICDAIPKTISVAEYQSALGGGSSSGAAGSGSSKQQSQHQQGKGRVKGMASQIDDRAAKEKGGEQVVGASPSVGLGLGTGLQPRR